MKSKIFKMGYILSIFMTIFLSPIFTSAQESIETGIEIIPDSDSSRWGSRFTIMSLNTLGALYRYPAEEKRWLLMVNATAYFRDVLAGTQTYITGAADGETWSADGILPDGSTITWPVITFYRSYGGRSNCFVSPSQTVCGSTSVNVLWWTSAVRCGPPGLWSMSFYNNSNYLFSTQFTLLPQIYSSKVPLYNQGDYGDRNNPDHLYDTICRTTTCTTRDCDAPCGTRENEVPVTIAQEGCYLTDAAMILSYHGVTVNPPTLNTWLINYKDNRGRPLGYDINGKVNPYAVTHYASAMRAHKE